jgi:hypothetical protein
VGEEGRREGGVRLLVRSLKVLTYDEKSRVILVRFPHLETVSSWLRVPATGEGKGEELKTQMLERIISRSDAPGGERVARPSNPEEHTHTPKSNIS